jgi:porin
LRLRHAQLNIGGAWKWSTWVPAGPKVFTLSNLYLYKAWADNRVEMKAGYIYNDIEFMGLQIGGSSATAAQGVYAVLPNQVGMSYYPLPAPSLNLKVRGPRRVYWKGAAQRSLDPGGAAATLNRNQSGLRFLPKGDKLLLINELGYQRASSVTAGQVWIRGGLLYNNTLYTNKATDAKEAGNYCGYFLADFQIRKTQPEKPGQGVYVGGTYMAAPAKYNSYSSYYEGRVYQRAPFRSRPDDLASLVASYRGYSKYVTGALASQNKSFWRSSTSLTASYSIHISQGMYLSAGLSYVYGPTITPRASNPLTANINWSTYL